MKETILYQDVKDAQNATLYVFDRTGEINEYRINGPTLIGRDSPTSEAGRRSHRANTAISFICPPEVSSTVIWAA